VGDQIEQSFDCEAIEIMLGRVRCTNDKGLWECRAASKRL